MEWGSFAYETNKRGHFWHFKGNSASLPEKGDTGGVDPAGDTGGDPFWNPGGFIIIILRVTLIASSDESSLYDLPFPPSDAAETNHQPDSE